MLNCVGAMAQPQGHLQEALGDPLDQQQVEWELGVVLCQLEEVGWLAFW